MGFRGQSPHDTAIGGPQGQFPSTHRSLLEAAAGSMPNEALDRVIAVYWKPVYRFIRLKYRHDNEDAKDVTQSFFATAIERDFFARYDPSQASFRTYLRMAVERFAANQHAASKRQKRGAGFEFVPAEDHEAAGASPEEAFEREWRRQLFTLAVDGLRGFATREGKELQFSLFEAYDLANECRPSYAELAARHQIAETAVTNALAWARRMLRGFVADRLRGITPGDLELREEMRRVWS